MGAIIDALLIAHMYGRWDEVVFLSSRLETLAREFQLKYGVQAE